MRDPSLWGVVAEERQVWKTETTLLNGPIMIGAYHKHLNLLSTSQVYF